MKLFAIIFSAIIAAAAVIYGIAKISAKNAEREAAALSVLKIAKTYMEMAENAESYCIPEIANKEWVNEYFRAVERVRGIIPSLHEYHQKEFQSKIDDSIKRVRLDLKKCQGDLLPYFDSLNINPKTP